MNIVNMKDKQMEQFINNHPDMQMEDEECIFCGYWMKKEDIKSSFCKDWASRAHICKSCGKTNHAIHIPLSKLKIKKFNNLFKEFIDNY